MSLELNNAIKQRLTGEDGASTAVAAALAALLATDLDSGLPAVYYANKNDNVVAYPAITYRANAGSINNAFEDGSGAAVDNPIYDLEIWENTRNSNIIEAIAAQVRLLLDDRKGAPKLTLANNGVCFSFQTLTTLQVLYDDRANAWFGLWRFAAVEGV